MSYVMVKQKYQVTLPVTLRKQLNVKEGDTLEINIKNGTIVLTPQSMIKKKTPDHLLDYIGSAKGLFANASEADDFIRKERDLWD